MVAALKDTSCPFNRISNTCPICVAFPFLDLFCGLGGRKALEAKGPYGRVQSTFEH